MSLIVVSKTMSIHLSQMIEPELAFAELKDDMACASTYLQYVVSSVSLHNSLTELVTRSGMNLFIY
jgi:aspartyl/asparaginyl-tRNA synthetase